MNASFRAACSHLLQEGRFSLLELLLQSETPDEELFALADAFHREQASSAPAFLWNYYEECESRLDGSNLTELLSLYQLLLRAAFTAFPPHANEEILERLARLIYFLAYRRGMRLLPDEIVLFPQQDQAFLCALQEKQQQLERLPFQGRERLPLVSILIPAYNLPDIFQHTMRSAAIQDYPNLEILVIDNSTNEDTACLMERYRDDPRVRYIRNKEAKSKEENFARFEKEAQGEYLQWLMQDDILLPGKISKMANVLLTQPQVSLVTSQRAFIDGRGKVLEDLAAPDFSIEGDSASFSGHSAARAMLLHLQNIIGEPSAVLFRRQDLSHHYWHADCRGYLAISDVVMWLELLSQGELFVFREPLSCYRRHGAQEGQSPDVLLLSRLEWMRLIGEEEQRGSFLSRIDHASMAERLLEDYRETLPPVLRAASPERRREYEAALWAFVQG